ncbi:MAG: YraN family protein, partial [Planctomyces sp.]|jgi:putative endonuclease
VLAARRIWWRLRRRVDAWLHPRMPETTLTGRHAERLVARELRRCGFRILGRNLRVPMGEADLLARDPDGRTIVLVEVKARVRPLSERPEQRPPEAQINEDKRSTLRGIMTHLVRRNRWHHLPRRIDVVAVELEHGTMAIAELRHHRDAVAVRDRGGSGAGRRST